MLANYIPNGSPPKRKLSAPHALLFVGPAIVLFLLFVLLPALQSFSWCVQKWDGLTDAQFVGLRSFRYLLFSSDGFWTALGNNLFIIFVIPLLMVPLSLFGQYRSDWGMAFAGLVLVVAPTLIICLTLQRYITKGLTAGAVKG